MNVVQGITWKTRGRQMKKALLVTLFLAPAVLAGIATTNTFAQDFATGPYLGQAVPGDTAAIFAPGIISTGDDGPGRSHEPGRQGNVLRQDGGRRRGYLLFKDERQRLYGQTRKLSVSPDIRIISTLNPT